MELHVAFEPDEGSWVRVTCAPMLEEARGLVRDALAEWLSALTSTERASIGEQATRETLTVSVA